MQNLKYLKRVVDEETRFGVVLNEPATKHPEPIQLKLALSLLEYFNHGKYVYDNDVTRVENTFYVSKEKYFKPKTTTSKPFSIRVNLSDSDEEIDMKIAKMRQKIADYRNLK